MERYDNLANLIRDNIIECKLVLKEENPKELFDKINSIINIVRDKNKLAQLSNYEIFLTFLNCSNTDIFTYEETLERVNEIKNNINSWTYDNTKDIFKQLVDKTNDVVDEKTATRLFEKLGLTPEFAAYRIRGVFLIMNRFLEYKARIANLDKNQSLLVLNPQPKLTPMMKKQMIDKIYIDCNMDNIFKVLNNYINSNIEELNTRKKNAKKRIEIEELILSKINDGSIEEMRDCIPEEWCIYLDLDIANELLLIILDNIKIEYNTEMTMNKISNSLINKTPLTKYLYDHNINPKEFDEEVLEQLEKNENSIDNIEFLLSIKLNPVNYTNILLTLSNEHRDKLNMLIKSKILTTTTINNNLDILDQSFKKIINNYEILNKLQPEIDYSNKYYNDQVLLLDTKDLRNNISIVKEYKFNEEEKDYYIYLLCNPSMVNIYDIILENELDKRLLLIIGKTPNPLNAIKRVLIYKQLDIPIVDNNGNLKKDIYDERRFIIYDQDIDEYLGNAVEDRTYIDITGNKINDENKLLLIQELDKNYLFTKSTYKINETIISRPKVLKNLNRVIEERLDIRKCLLQVLISSSIYNEKNIFEIEQELKTKKLSTR